MTESKTTEYRTDCRFFTGYSPCRFRRSCPGCPHHEPVGRRILLVQLGAMGDVLRTTALLPAIRRVHPRAHLTWLTSEGSAPLLRNNPLIDRVLVLSPSTSVLLDSLRFDLALCPEKSPAAGALLNYVRADERRGFGLDEGGAIVPMNPEAATLYRQGLDDEAKFFANTLSTVQLRTEALGIPFQRDRYVVVLTDQERRWARDDRQSAGVADDEVLVGWNTGCSARYPYKKLDAADQIRSMIAAWGRIPRQDRTRFALLGGGREDEERNTRIARALEARGIPVARTPCLDGVRRGLSSVAACDMVVTGDTLGLHLAIGLKKPVVVWFGISCHQEIDLFGRGIKVLSTVGCRPCLLAECSMQRKCFEELPWDAYSDAVARMADTLLREGQWMGEELIGTFPPSPRIPPDGGRSPGPPG